MQYELDKGGFRNSNRKAMKAITTLFAILLVAIGGAASGDATSRATTEIHTVESAENTHWLTTGSGIRHNSGCRYYRNSKGRACSQDEGRACKICGG